MDAKRQASESSEISTFATIARNSFDGLNTGTGRADTSTGATVRGFLAMRVFRWRILNVPKPRTSILRCSCNACLIASRNESTTRAQSFFEIIGPAVCAIWVVTCSTRSALVIRRPQHMGHLLPPNFHNDRTLPNLSQALAGFDERVEQGSGVMRAWRGFRVILNREHRQLAMP